ncbi:MAG TPA: FHA domain-containing protein [Anaerolineales bacterium]
MIRCSSCRSQEMAGALFCSMCGAPLDTRPWISLNILDHEEILPIDSQEEITLGRTSTGQPFAPDVDLAPFHAYEAGVSRLHAALRITGERVMVKDLGSANGTHLNGEKIPANIPFPVAHRDILTLGKLKIQVLIQKPSRSLE